jgi:hypothetical protein
LFTLEIYFRGMFKRRTSSLAVTVALLGVVATTTAISTQDDVATAATTSVTMEYLGRANSGSGLAGSEIPAYDSASKRLFVTNGATKKIDIFDISAPATPTLVKSVDLASLGATDIQSVAAKNGLVVAAATMTSKVNKGKLFFMSTDGTIDSRASSGIEVGYLPDSVHFSPDGKYVLSANEGEPKDYCKVNGEVPAASDPVGSVSIIDVTKTTLSADTLDFSSFDTQADLIKASGARIFGPDASVGQDLEPEYVAISADSTTAFVTMQENNAVAEIDIVNKKVTRIMGLGYKDHMVPGWGLDASDRDPNGAPVTNISNWPVKGIFMPDAIGTYVAADGEAYFVTANEGDAREWPCLLGGTSTTSAEAEDERVGSRGVDGTYVATALADNTRLGRLGATRFFPATHESTGTAATANGSTNFTSLYSFGARSMSIWSTSSKTGAITRASLVADTGDDIESKINELLPNYFNADWDTDTGTVNSKEGRSDNKGPEPEGLALGEVFGRTIAFVGLERIGGVMAFDITDPTAPTYLHYLNTAVFTGVGGEDFKTTGAPAGDVSPEGLLFVKASDSPTGVPLLIVANELSGTTAIYKVVGTSTAPKAPTDVTASVTARTATIAWKAPNDDGGSKITAYEVSSSPGAKTCSTTGALTCEISGLDHSTKYTFSVIAKTATGSSSAVKSDEVTTGPMLATTAGTTVTLAKQPPAKVARNSTIAVSGRIVTIALEAPTDGSVSRYRVELRPVKTGRMIKRTLTASAGQVSTVQISLKKAGFYELTVRAFGTKAIKPLWRGQLISTQ